jgi:GAF domain-containing protein
LSSSAADAFDDPNLVQALGSAVSAAALALSVPQAGVQAESFTAQLEAVREIAHAVAGGAELGRLMDLAVRHIRRITQAEVCTVSLAAEGKLSVAGKAFRDDLLYPERWEPGDPALQSKATGKAWRTQKPVTHLGLVPSVEAGPWRAFAGKSGKYFVTALPLASRLGVLAVYTNGAMPLLDVQIKFLETVAALLSVGLVSSGLKPASAEASRADC